MPLGPSQRTRLFQDEKASLLIPNEPSRHPEAAETTANNCRLDFFHCDLLMRKGLSEERKISILSD